MDKQTTGSLSVTCALRQAKTKSEKLQDLATQEADVFDQIARLVESIREAQSKFSG